MPALPARQVRSDRSGQPGLPELLDLRELPDLLVLPVPQGLLEVPDRSDQPVLQAQLDHRVSKDRSGQQGLPELPDLWE